MSERKVSSGTKKAESLEKKTGARAASKAQGAKQQGAERAVKSKTAGKGGKDGGAKLSAKEQRKLEAAKLKAERQQKRTERKLEHRQKREERAAALKLKLQERKERRIARREAMKSKTQRERIEEKKQERLAKTEAAKARREARLNAKIAKREHALKVRAEKRKTKEARAPGFGGWLAAVIALGVSTLALGTMLTFGWINMNGMQANMAADTTHSLYELNSIVDNLDANLAKARISSSAGDRARIFTDIAIESEMAESAIERLPVAGELTRSMTSFINRMGESAQDMLLAVAEGNSLSPSQQAGIEYMYECNRQLKEFLNGLTTDCTDRDILDALSGKGMMFEGFEGYIDPAVETPKEIYDGPFAENTQTTNALGLEGLEEITAESAEQLCAQWFASYGITETRCTGETTAKQLNAYNVRMTGENGEEYFAQVSKAGGRLVMFDSFKECSEHNFTIENCMTLAQNFLNECGYEGMTCVWSGESGTTCNLNYVYSQGGVAVYPDMVKVKVCEERGIVTGLEALPYVLNHTERTIESPALGMEQAEAKLGGRLNVKSSRLAIIPKNGEEALAYEFCGTYGGRTYYVYLSATTGEELDVFTVIGNALM